MSGIRIYIEGGGDRAEGKAQLRRGFGTFFRDLVARARAKRLKIDTIACGSRNDAFGAFTRALIDHPAAFNVLLVDSEAPVSTPKWDHLRARDNWQPTGLDETHCHLMVQVMESWLIADLPGLQAYYGKGFNPNPIPNPGNIEGIEKARIYQALRDATRQTQKGEYHKIKHAADLLEKIEAATVRQSLPHCDELFKAIEAVISES